jgi:hypothetical protein
MKVLQLVGHSEPQNLEGRFRSDRLLLMSTDPVAQVKVWRMPAYVSAQVLGCQTEAVFASSLSQSRTAPAPPPETQALRRLELANFLPVPSPKLYIALGFIEGRELSSAQDFRLALLCNLNKFQFMVLYLEVLLLHRTAGRGRLYRVVGWREDAGAIRTPKKEDRIFAYS